MKLSVEEASAMADAMTSLVGSRLIPADYEIAFRVLRDFPEAATIAGATAPLVPDSVIDATGYRGGTSASADELFTPGALVLVPFTRGTKGAEARVSALRGGTVGTLVPARECRWTPRAGLPYVVRLIRRIGQGRTQVWLVRPVDPAADERRAAVADARDRVLAAGRAATDAVNDDATGIVTAAAAAVTIPAIPKPIWAPDMRPEVEKIEWGPWEGTTERKNTTPYWVHGLSRPQPSERVTGRRTATWGGQRGVYDVVFDRSAWQSGYESPDGGRRTTGGWLETCEASTFVDGVDVVAQRSDAHDAAIAAYKEVRTASAARHEERRIAINAIVASVQVPRLPSGNSINVAAVIHLEISRRIAEIEER